MTIPITDYVDSCSVMYIGRIQSCGPVLQRCSSLTHYLDREQCDYNFGQNTEFINQIIATCKPVVWVLPKDSHMNVVMDVVQNELNTCGHNKGPCVLAIELSLLLSNEYCVTQVDMQNKQITFQHKPITCVHPLTEHIRTIVSRLIPNTGGRTCNKVWVLNRWRLKHLVRVEGVKRPVAMVMYKHRLTPITYLRTLARRTHKNINAM